MDKFANVTIRKCAIGFLASLLLLELVVICGIVPVQATNTETDFADIDYNIWTLDLPTGTILSSGDLKRQLYNDWWYKGEQAFVGYDMFSTPQRGAGEKMFGSPYVRCELREIIYASGDQSGSWGTNANWGRLGYHKMVTEVKVDRINDNHSGDYAQINYTCIGQVWGASGGEPAMFCLMFIDAKPGESSFRMRSADTKGDIISASVHIPVGTSFIVTYECIGGVLKVWVESEGAKIVKTKIYDGPLANPADSNSYYFKVGNYDQSADSKGDKIPDPNDVNTIVGFKSILVEHNPIRGRLTYEDGRPVTNTKIDYVLDGGGASNLKMSTVTDADGYYYISNVPSNGGLRTASVSISVPTLSGYKSDKIGTIHVAAAATSSIIGVRSGDAYDIVYSPIVQLSKAPTPKASIDYATETLKGLNGVYTINGKIVDITGVYPIEPSWFGTTITIIKKSTGKTNDSVAQKLAIESRPPTPSPSNIDCTTSKNNNGGITNVTNKMEFSADNGVTWKKITGLSVSGLKPGTYLVRIKATHNTFKSDHNPVVVNSYKLPSYYSVQRGDSLWLIGLKFGVSVDAIKKLNGLTSDLIYVGQLLQISQNSETELSQSNILITIKSGDTLWLLAQRYETSVSDIKALNGLNSDMIYPGQQLRIPQKIS